MLSRLVIFLGEYFVRKAVKQIAFNANLSESCRNKMLIYESYSDFIFHRAKSKLQQIDKKIFPIICIVRIWIIQIQLRICVQFLRLKFEYIKFIIAIRNLTNFICKFTTFIAIGLCNLGIRLKIKSPPGSYLLTTANFLYKKETVKGVFEQIVSDWRTDYFDALSEKKTLKRRWISVRGHYEFYSAMFKQSPIGDLIEEIRRFVK